VHRVAAGLHAGRHHRVDVEIGRRAVGLERKAVIGQREMWQRGVVARMDGNGFQPEVARRAQDAQRNLAAIGDQ
jgi:hypothetical protein